MNYVLIFCNSTASRLIYALNVIQRNDGWKAFCIQGALDFSLIGILSIIATVLANNNISIFAVSTYNTDYILIKNEDYQKSLEILKSIGYDIVDC